MTWTKLGDEFGDQCRELSDAAFRTHVEGLLWCMRRETGGWLDTREVRRFAESPHAEMAVAELVACGWWSLDGSGYRINHHMDLQVEPEVLAKRRENDAARQRRKRARAARLTEESRRDDPGDHPRDPGLDWSGLDGNQNQHQGEHEKPSMDGALIPRPDASRPVRDDPWGLP